MPQILRKAMAGVHTVGAGFDHHLTGDDGAVQKGAGGDNHGLGFINGTQLGLYTGDGSIFCQNLQDLSLFQLQVFLLFQGVLHIFLIFAPVGLGPQGMDCRAFAFIQHPVLDAGVVCGNTHLPAQRVQLPDQVALAGAADGRIAGHIAHRVQRHGKQHRLQPHAGASQCRFDAGVTRADDSDSNFCLILIHGTHLGMDTLP